MVLMAVCSTLSAMVEMESGAWRKGRKTGQKDFVRF
jgi:hypothetical protein